VLHKLLAMLDPRRLGRDWLHETCTCPACVIIQNLVAAVQTIWA